MFFANKYINLVNAIKIGFSHKLPMVRVPYNKKLINLLNVFIKVNYIKAYIVHNNLIFVKLYTGLENDINKKKIKHVSKPSIKYTISYKDLAIFTKYDFTVTVILHTSSGIMVHQEAIKKKVGGQVLFILFN